MEKTRRARHDLRHHLGVLSSMAEHGDVQEIRDYISELLKQTARIDMKWFCENTTVNGLLQYYIGMAEEYGIDCTVHAKCGELSVSPVDLTVILGNALENAVNASRKCGENRWIRVAVGVISGSLAIQIDNACESIHPSETEYRDNVFLPARAFLS